MFEQSFLNACTNEVWSVVVSAYLQLSTPKEIATEHIVFWLGFGAPEVKVYMNSCS